MALVPSSWLQRGISHARLGYSGGVPIMSWRNQYQYTDGIVCQPTDGGKATFIL